MATSPAHSLSAGLTWKSNVNGGSLPQGAVQGGYRYGNQPYYVGRVLDADGNYRPAKCFMIDGTLHANYYYNNKEIESAPTFDVLVSADDRVIVEWVKAANGKVPAYAVQAERDIRYIGRHEAGGELVVGEVDTDIGQCIVVTCYKVYKFTEYEVLCAYPHASTST